MEPMSLVVLVVTTILSLIITSVFGIVTAKLGKVIQTYNTGKEAIAEEAAQKAKDEILKEVDKKDAYLESEISDTKKALDSIMKGLLSVQGRQFKKHCRELLEKGHEITTAEYEEIVSDHEAYNGLKGNHEGDALFDAVEVKYKAQISQN